MQDFITCSDCGATLTPTESGDLTESTLPCPSCGSIRRTRHVFASDTGVIALEEEYVKVRDARTLRSKSGKKRSARELIAGLKKGGDGRPVHLYRLFSRDNDEYHEKVVDAETGELIVEKHEPLSQHVTRKRNRKKQ